MAKQQNQNPEEKKSERQKMVEEGVAAKSYTTNNWFVKIYPCLAIGKYKFAFVVKDTHGTGFDIYMDIEDLELWVDDILDESKTFMKTILAEKKAGVKYPKTYKYITGIGASKTVGICPSTIDNAFATINGGVMVKGKWQYANVPADYNWFRKFAKEFRRETPEYFREMTQKTLEVARSYRAQLGEDDYAMPLNMESPNVSAERPSQAAPKNDTPPAQNSKPAPKAESQPVSKPEPKPAEPEQPFCEYLKSTTKLVAIKNTDILVIKGKNSENKERIVYFMPAECKDAGNEFANFKKMAEQRTNIGFRILISPENGKLRFKKFMVG